MAASCGCCCRSSCKVAVFAVLVMVLQELAAMLYIVLEAVGDGFTLQRAVKDMVFELSEMGHPYFFLFNNHFSKVSLPVLESDDHVTAVCKVSLYLKPTEVSLAEWRILDTADPAPTEERMAAYLKACREVYAAAPPAQRAVLEAFKPPLGVPSELPNITAPFYHGPMSWEEVEAQRIRRAEEAAARPPASERWKPVEELEPKFLRRHLAKSQVRPVQEEVIPASKVADAIREGKVAVFDATQLLPKEIFNLSMADIARLHGEEAEKINIYRQRGPSAAFAGISLQELGERFERLKKAGKLYHHFSAVPKYPRWVAPPPPTQPWLRRFRDLLTKVGPMWFIHPEGTLHFLRRILTQPTVNVRRLPKLPPVELEKTLGSPPWLERVWSMYWCGAVGPWWHNDEPDNLLIATNGEMTVTVFEKQNDTDILSGMRGPVHRFAQAFDLLGFNPDGAEDAWVRENGWIKKFPYIRVHLKPGMGVTVPSRTYHSITSEHADRLLLNAFLIPKYKAMEDAPAGSGSFFGKGRQPEPYMALFHLKMSSLFRLWDTRRLGGFFEMMKLETF